ncbi:hypothetical protein B484DRAFT_439622, partial [Ochromonadaceae sp. CCMP2298]
MRTAVGPRRGRIADAPVVAEGTVLISSLPKKVQRQIHQAANKKAKQEVLQQKSLEEKRDWLRQAVQRVVVEGERINTVAHSQPSVPAAEAETQISEPDSDNGDVGGADSDYEGNLVSAEPNVVGGIFHADPLTKAMSDNAMESWVAQDAALINCIAKHKKHILQTHWILVGLAGCELRESTKHFDFKGAD